MGLSADKLRTLDEHLRVNYIDQQRYAGVVTGICRHGELIHVSPLGFRDMERKLPVERDTIFRIYSMSKPITSVALMTLYEQGMFQLDDPVSEYIPQFKNLEVFDSGVFGDFETTRVNREMTVRDLLSHQSGLTYGFVNRTNVDRAYREAGVGEIRTTGSLQKMIDCLSEIPLEFSPGDRWNYSVSTDVCGYLVEVISGKSFDVFLDEVIFQPLGMVDSGFYVKESEKERESIDEVIYVLPNQYKLNIDQLLFEMIVSLWRCHPSLHRQTPTYCTKLIGLDSVQLHAIMCLWMEWGDRDS